MASELGIAHINCATFHFTGIARLSSVDIINTFGIGGTDKDDLDCMLGEIRQHVAFDPTQSGRL